MTLKFVPSFSKLLISLCLLMFLAGISVAQTDTEQLTDRPQVVSAQAPQYPASAFALGIKGEVRVEVEINNKGEVVSVRTISGRDRLREVSEKASKNWKFVALSGTDKEVRKVRITLTIQLFRCRSAKPGNYHRF